MASSGGDQGCVCFSGGVVLGWGLSGDQVCGSLSVVDRSGWSGPRSGAGQCRRRVQQCPRRSRGAHRLTHRDGGNASGSCMHRPRHSRIQGGNPPSGAILFDDVSDEEVAKALAAGFYPTTSSDDLGAADALFICVPSPLGRNREPDMGPIRDAGETVAGVVRRGTLVSLESTTYPGTTRDIILPAATNGGLRLDDEVFVAYSPEKTSPGSEDSMTDIPKLVGGITPTSGRSPGRRTRGWQFKFTSCPPQRSPRWPSFSKPCQQPSNSRNVWP